MRPTRRREPAGARRGGNMRGERRMLARDILLMLYVLLAVSQITSILESPYRYPSGDFECLFLLGVIIISFPGNLLLLLGGLCCHQLCPGCDSLDASLVLLLLLTIGYFQLFWLVPKVFTDPSIIVLNLNDDTKNATAGERTDLPVTSDSFLPAHQHLILHFDAHGLTPLERALQEIPPKRCVSRV
ncbi:MAG: hypothetical protein M3430_12160 [Acidobacteriota bacterium]|nr:hypothetical protein [Acidobacteriota bacterium]